MRAHVASVRGHAEKLGRLYQDKPSDAQVIAILLMSLPPSYDALAVALDAHPSSGDIDFVVGRLLNEEQRQETEIGGVMPSYGESTTALNANTRDMSRVTCFKCHKRGHYQSQCPEPGPLVPLPPRDATQASIANTTFQF
ncbi:hypothetical protein GGX14DRAFT_369237 [Mycena pura]|uniref:CCHC-type domain-containing protein n=1 Tax=Mycena pura TaxID=153505 RepID=A0AAD6VA05_9AGAR|nr:hypothetical protein GGX14DRAFT_369237 [Mycena pura]